MKRRNVALVIISLFFAFGAMYIIPWGAVSMLVVFEVPQYAPFTKEVSFTSHDRTLTFTVNGSISLHARGTISADNPITAEALIWNGPLENLTSFANITDMIVWFDDSLEFPLTHNRFGWDQIGYVVISLIPWPFEGRKSTTIVYLSSGEYGVTLQFLDCRTVVLQEVKIANLLIIGPPQETFTYVTAVTFVSLDVIIVALMLLDLRDTRTDEGNRRQKKQTETEPWKILCY